MNIIQSYQEAHVPHNLLYLAKPVYGGWVTFTAHLSHKLKAPIHKITSRTEKNKRDFGYECQYRNISYKVSLFFTILKFHQKCNRGI